MWSKVDFRDRRKGSQRFYFEVQISRQARHFGHDGHLRRVPISRQVQRILKSWQAQHFVNLEVQIMWQVHARTRSLTLTVTLTLTLTPSLTHSRTHPPRERPLDADAAEHAAVLLWSRCSACMWCGGGVRGLDADAADDNAVPGSRWMAVGWLLDRGSSPNNMSL